MVDQTVRELPSWIQLQNGVENLVARMAADGILRIHETTIFSLLLAGLIDDRKPAELGRIRVVEICRERLGEGYLFDVRQFAS
jgi:hypothetical protein